MLRSGEARLRLLHRADIRDLGEPRDRLWLCVDHDPAGDVVEDHRPVGRGRHGPDVGDDPALRRLVVVRRDHEEAVDAERVRLLGEVDRVGGRVRPGAGDHRATVAHGLDRRRVECHPLLVRQSRRLAGRARYDDPVRAVVEEVIGERAEAVEVDRAVVAKRGDDRGQDLAEHAADCSRSGLR